MGENMIPASPAAQKAGLSSEQMRRRLMRGEIKGELVAGRWLVDAASLAAWIARQPEPQPAA
jgi:hypothetical protein